jgi:AraC family transcriptional regulator, melibiose operon regulatory protein
VARFDPTRPDFSPYGFTCVRWTATAMPRSDRHNEIELNLLERGRLVYLMGGRRVAVRAGKLTVFWAGVPHQVLDFQGLTDYFVLTIPLAWFLQWRLPDHFTQPILNGGMLVEPDAGRLAPDRTRFEAWVEDVRVGSEERRHASLLEIEARLRRLAEGVAPDAPGHSRRKSPTVLEPVQLSRAEQMACFIAQNYTEALTADTIGKHVGLHPNYAMALFQRRSAPR